MLKVQLRGITIDPDGLGATLRLNGSFIFATAPIELQVNNNFKQVVATPNSRIVHPSGSFTDIHYLLSERVYYVDICRAFSTDANLEFDDAVVKRGGYRLEIGDSEEYDYFIRLGAANIVGEDYIGYRAADAMGFLVRTRKQELTPRRFAVQLSNGNLEVDMRDDVQPANRAIFVSVEGNGGVRLEWDEATTTYHAISSEMLTYLTAVEGAVVGVTVSEIN